MTSYPSWLKNNIGRELQVGENTKGITSITFEHITSVEYIDLNIFDSFYMVQGNVLIKNANLGSSWKTNKVSLSIPRLETIYKLNNKEANNESNSK